jgi:membrane protein DedA with SNARE-associated domain
VLADSAARTLIARSGLGFNRIGSTAECDSGEAIKPSNRAGITTGVWALGLPEWWTTEKVSHLNGGVDASITLRVSAAAVPEWDARPRAPERRGDRVNGPLEVVADWANSIIRDLGYVGIALLVALENVFPPIPSELILPMAGFLAGRGEFWLPGVIAASTVGSVAGALALYAAGHWFGRRHLRNLVKKHGQVLFVSTDDVDKAEEWFGRHGSKSVLIGRCAPVVRSLISIPAGFARMRLPKFVIFTAIGSAIWNSLLTGLGWFLGDQWQVVRDYMQYLEYAVIIALAAAVAWFIWRRRSAH